MNPSTGSDYNYEAAGFDGFMSRSIDNLVQVNLDSNGPASTQMRFDSTQVSGFMGDTLQIGAVRINRSSITMTDGRNTRLLIGEDVGGF